jgi:protein tyrosine kinase modulator
MELRQYARIVWKRIWVPATVLAVALVASLALRQEAPPQYRASVKVLVDVPPLQTVEGMGFDPRLTAPQATEYLVDDFSVFVTGDAVAQRVSQRLADRGIQVPAGAIQSSTASQQIHRVVEIQVVWGNPEQALAIIDAATKVLQEDAPTYFGRLGSLQPRIEIFDGPRVGPVSSGLSERLDLPVRLLLAVLAGIALCFVLDYLDDSIRGCQEMEAMGIKVLTEVPGQRRW